MNLSELSSKRIIPLHHLLPDTTLWLMKLSEIDESEMTQIRQILTPEEIAKMATFNQRIHQWKFGLCRALYKTILAEQLNLSLDEIYFSYTEKGKPFLENCKIHFNLSHSEDFAIIGTSRHQIGVDIEWIDNSGSLRGTADLILTDQEKEWVGDDQTRIYQIWTIKEAILKCTGEGVTAETFPQLIFESDRINYKNFWIKSFLDIPDYVYSISLYARNNEGIISNNAPLQPIFLYK